MLKTKKKLSNKIKNVWIDIRFNKYFSKRSIKSKTIKYLQTISKRKSSFESTKITF